MARPRHRCKPQWTEALLWRRVIQHFCHSVSDKMISSSNCCWPLAQQAALAEFCCSFKCCLIWKFESQQLCCCRSPTLMSDITEQSFFKGKKTPSSLGHIRLPSCTLPSGYCWTPHLPAHTKAQKCKSWLTRLNKTSFLFINHVLIF